MRFALLALAVFGGLYALHHLAMRAERRGWIYYRQKRGGSGTLGNAFLEVQSILEPSKEHVIEERLKDASEQSDSGDPPEPGESANRIEGN